MTVEGAEGNNQVLRTEELMKRRERMELKYNTMQCKTGYTDNVKQ